MGKYAGKHTKIILEEAKKMEKIGKFASKFVSKIIDAIAKRSTNPLFILLVGATILFAFYWIASPYQKCMRLNMNADYCNAYYKAW